MYVLDTNTVIYYFKGMGQVKTHLENTLATDIAIPTVVLFELTDEENLWSCGS